MAWQGRALRVKEGTDIRCPPPLLGAPPAPGSLGDSPPPTAPRTEPACVHVSPAGTTRRRARGQAGGGAEPPPHTARPQALSVPKPAFRELCGGQASPPSTALTPDQPLGAWAGLSSLTSPSPGKTDVLSCACFTGREMGSDQPVGSGSCGQPSPGALLPGGAAGATPGDLNPGQPGPEPHLSPHIWGEGDAWNPGPSPGEGEVPLSLEKGQGGWPSVMRLSPPHRG